MQQVDAEFRFEAADLLGQGGLGQMQLLRRSGEGAVARDRVEGA